MKNNRAVRSLKKALSKPELYSDEEYKYLLNGYYQQIIKKELKKHATKQKGFGYSSTINLSDATSRADDGVRGESEQPAEPRES